MRFLWIARWSFFLSILFICSATFAQISSGNIIESKKTTDGRYNFLKLDRFKRGLSFSLPPIEQAKALFGLGFKHSFVQNSTDNNTNFRSDLQGLEDIRYNQYFNGIKVEYGVITLHSKNASLDAVTGEYYNIDENFSTISSISESAAFSNAISFVGAKKYSWQDTSFVNPLLKELPKAELVICKNFLNQSASSVSPQMELAYKFAIYATEPLRYDYIYVSARTGDIIHADPIIKHVSGTGATRYSGSRTIATNQLSGGNYVLKDSGGNYNLATYNLNRGTSYTSATNFSDNDNNWTSTEFNNSNFDNAALDAHWGAMMTLDYWKTVHNRNSYDNNGRKINSYVHYGSLYANAFWNGYEMTYGDGNGSTMFPLTSIDICGHEIGHAVCQYTAGLIYSNESGALNEGFSDIWGACIKRYADPLKNTWLLGEEISSTASPIRSMINPKSKGQPDTYKGINWYTGTGDNGGVHYNSGVLNYWFYLLTEGKAGTNDKGTSYNVTGIGITKAAQIAYRAENVYLFPSAQYADARIFTIQAAEDLFGAGSNEVLQTAEAWKAVGVNDVLAKPDSVSAVLGNNAIAVNWRFNNFQSITGFKLERAINGTNAFTVIATVGASLRSFIDTGYINNSINQYRLRSYKDTSHSDYSQVTSIAAGTAPLIMINGSYTTCGNTFLDPGGLGNYSNGNYTTTVRPATTGNNLKVVFTQFNIGNDYLYIYNGPSTSSPLIGPYSGTNMPQVIQSTAPGGELTFVFNPYNSNISPGWQAYISCFKPVASPTNLTVSADTLRDVHLTWSDNANDETHYIVERSLNDSLHYLPLVTLSANASNFDDTTAPANSYIYYRLRAFRDSVSSPYSNVVSIVNGNVFIMRNVPVNTCGITFLDPGGQGNYNYGNYITVVRPAIGGNNIKVLFSEFNIGYDYLYIYNGPTASSASLLGAYTGTNKPPALQSTAPGGELTFVFNPYNSNTSPGWEAYLSCFKRVEAPSNLVVVADSLKDMHLTWTDNANDETRFVVERSVNDPLHYLPLVSLPANTSNYDDTVAPANTYIYYRVRAYRDTVTSAYSNRIFVVSGNIFIMQNLPLTTCDITFLDPGGQGNYNYGNYITVVRPALSGNNIKVLFSDFNVGYDYLYIYNGTTISSASLLGVYTGINKPPVLQSSAPGGELTFVFNPYNSNTSPGWQAYISCFKPVAAPSNLLITADSLRDVRLTWTDNANDETGYVVERSLNDSLNYQLLSTLPANSNSFSDAAAPDNSYIFYRVRAYRDAITSPYSKEVAVTNGNIFIMRTASISTCGTTFLDPGGFGNYSNSVSYVTTFTSPIAGNKIKVNFSSFSTESCCDRLYIYNGPNTSSPLLGSFAGTAIPPSFESTAPNGEMTFVFSADGSSTSFGWAAYVSCFKPIPKPTGLSVAIDALQRIKLNWSDNASDETGYIVERSVNAPSKFQPVAQLPLNSNQYTDSAAPANSFLYYRVRAYRDTLGSPYSDAASVAVGNAPFLMKDSTLITCDKVFMDPAGADVLPQNTYYFYRSTFKPDTASNRIKVTFSKFRINGTMQVFNGSSANSPSIGNYSGYYSSLSFDGTGAEGSLTFQYSGYSYGDTGWVAQVNCYKSVSKPSGLKAATDTSQIIKLTWKDNADDETKYVVERSVNTPVKYAAVAQLPSNTNQYSDSSAPVNSLLHYRVRAYRDTLGSSYSDTAVVGFGNAPFLMKDSTLITCDKVFMDPAGTEVMPLNSYYNFRSTFKPAIAGNRVRVTFSKFRISGTMQVYNGPSTNSPYISNYSGYYPSLTFDGTGAEGSLTFYYSAYSNADTGWVAQVSCYKPVAKPSGLKVIADTSQLIKLTWTDNANDETRYVVERSVNAPSKYISIGQLPANTNQYTDSSAPINSLLYYRVRAYRDTLGSFYSDTTIIGFGTAPFLMKDSTLITCDKVFMDPSGIDVLPQNNTYYNYRTTFKPAIAGNRVNVTFSKFRVNGTMYVYNGSSTNSTYVGSYSGYYPSLAFEGTGVEGSLTFNYSGYSYGDTGWVAQVSCYKPVAKPTVLKAAADTSQLIKLTWTDNANDETRYVVERSVNTPSKYISISQLPSNTNQYTDSSAPFNSLLYYRVRAYRDTMGSFYSDTAIVGLGNAPFLMKDSTLFTCDKVFMDPAGTEVLPQNTYHSFRTTFKSAITGNRVKVNFSKFRISGTMYVYNGPSTSSPIIGSYSGYFPSLAFEATTQEGSLTFNYYGYSYGDTGWVAQVSCYKPVARPIGLKATTDTTQLIKLTWTDNAIDETRYVVERSVNAPSKYESISQLPSNTNQYTDSSAPANSLLYYRVRAYRDTLGSFYSDTAMVASGNPPFLMKDSTLITCNKVFMDPAGADVLPQNTYYNIRATFKPAVAGNIAKVTFSKFRLNGYLYVYNGSSTSSPLIGSYSGYYPSLVFEGTGTEGSLTFYYNGYSYGDTGWIAQVSCYKPVAKPGNLAVFADSLKDVHLSWTDNANDETRYVVERSLSDTLNFAPLKNLSPNTTSYIDSTAPDNSYIYYRVRAYRDTTGSPYSNKAAISIGNIYVMQNGTVNGCGTLFLDPGGLGNYNNNSNYTTTFTPSETGKKIRVAFSEFNTESCCDYLRVYNGPNTLSPLLGSYGGSAIPPALQSTATNGELTFVFYSDGSAVGSGWLANISCVKFNDTLNTCSTNTNDLNTLTSNITGTSYQWQKYNGVAFVNITGDNNNIGTTSFSMLVRNAGIGVMTKFRCVVNGSFSREFVIIKGNRWMGTVSTDWNTPQNWSCGVVPNAATDVIVEGNMINNPSINNNVECRSLMIMPGANVHVANGYNICIRK